MSPILKGERQSVDPEVTLKLELAGKFFRAATDTRVLVHGVKE